VKGDCDMDVGAFVKQLAEAAPSYSDLERCGFTGEQSDEFIRSFHCVKRDRPLQEPAGHDCLLELLRNWDLSKVEIGMVRFPDPPAERTGKICVGCVEADPFAILSDDGEIVVHELGTKDHLLWRVAKNGSTLLNALVIAALFLGKRAVGTIDFSDYEAARSAALQCASAAGGEKYLDFYKMLLGAE